VFTVYGRGSLANKVLVNW